MALKIVCTGDPIMDVYLEGDNSNPDVFTPHTSHILPGGALNVCRNLEALVDTERDLFIPPDNYVYGDLNCCWFMVRTPSHTTGFPLLPKNKDATEHFEGDDLPDKIRESEAKAIIFADYNHGTLSLPPEEDEPPLQDLSFCIVDSRYRTFNPAWMKTARLKIWHATKSEYNIEYAKNFDYVLWTHGPGPVQILEVPHTFSGKPYPLEIIEVPRTRKIDVVGAGDTFTAAVAAKLALTSCDIINATRFGIEAAQDVIQKKYTAITTLKA